MYMFTIYIYINFYAPSTNVSIVNQWRKHLAYLLYSPCSKNNKQHTLKHCKHPGEHLCTVTNSKTARKHRKKYKQPAGHLQQQTIQSACRTHTVHINKNRPQVSWPAVHLHSIRYKQPVVHLANKQTASTRSQKYKQPAVQCTNSTSSQQYTYQGIQPANRTLIEN